MKKVTLTVAVLTLGLAACQDNAADNNMSTLNTVETEAVEDTNTAENSVDNALDAAGNAAENTVEAVENAADATADAAENTTN